MSEGAPWFPPSYRLVEVIVPQGHLTGDRAELRTRPAGCRAVSGSVLARPGVLEPPVVQRVLPHAPSRRRPRGPLGSVLLCEHRGPGQGGRRVRRLPICVLGVLLVMAKPLVPEPQRRVFIP